MKIKRIENAVARARDLANDEIKALAGRGGRYAGALSEEGYAAGYRQALSDVLLYIQTNGVCLPSTRGYWRR